MRWRGWICLWAASLVIGEVGMTRFESRPAPRAAPPSRWPAGTSLERPANRCELLVFLHPCCPCSRATLAELERVVARSRAAAELRILVSWDAEALPADGDALVERARAIPGALVAVDLYAREARRFGASASGQLLLYDAAGLLLFEGGITTARGHEGGNAGEDALVAVLRIGI